MKKMKNKSCTFFHYYNNLREKSRTQEKVRDKNLFIGIDLGGKEKKSTGICILKEAKGTIAPLENWCQTCQDVFGKEILRKIASYLKKTKVIAIDALLTGGRGKGKMRLYEKFLSQKIFRKARVTPIPPALMPNFCNFALELTKKLEKRGLVLDLNLIEVFPTLINKVCGENLGSKVLKRKLPCKRGNQKSALICAILAYLHSVFKTRYLGYRDGFLFLPEFSFWKSSWQKKFSQAWREKPYLKYRYLISNIFD